MKKWIAILCTLTVSLALMMTACGKQSSQSADLSAYAGQTIAGQITAVEGTAVTLQLGELSSGGSEGGQPQGEPPAKPDGDASGDSSQPSAPPDVPDGSSGADQPQGEPPAKPDGEGGGSRFTAGTDSLTVDLAEIPVTKDGESLEASALAVGDVLQLTVDAGGVLTAASVVSVTGGGNAPGGSGSSTVDHGSSATTLTQDETVSGGAYTSTGDNENALRVDGAAVTLDGVTVTKSAGASANAENGDFYGVNAALLAVNGAQVTIRNATVSSSAQNGNGIFSYGSGTTVTVSDTVITTTADNSGGIQTTGGGTTIAENLTVNTAGNSSAAIRSDRGGGTVSVTGGSYTSAGYNSPAVYSTAAITVKDATLTAENSEALVIEGKNSITLTDCTVTGNMSDTKGSSSDENVHNVMIYQSMSGDAAVGTSEFSMTGGSLTAKNGDMFYITNTACTMTLSGVDIRNEDADGRLLVVSGNSASHGWGTAGQNGAQDTLTADAQTLSGAIEVDSISTLQLTLQNGSSFTGTVNVMENAQGGTAVADNAVVTVGSGCTWTLTGNCTVTALTNNGTINYNGYTITLADGTVLQ